MFVIRYHLDGAQCDVVSLDAFACMGDLLHIV